MWTCVSSKYSSESSNTRAFFDRCEIRYSGRRPGAKNVWRESGTRGPNSDPQLHDPHTHLLSPVAFLAGIDHWNPEGIP